MQLKGYTPEKWGPEDAGFGFLQLGGGVSYQQTVCGPVHRLPVISPWGLPEVPNHPASIEGKGGSPHT